jgi:hypothetical protein
MGASNNRKLKSGRFVAAVAAARPGLKPPGCEQRRMNPAFPTSSPRTGALFVARGLSPAAMAGLHRRKNDSSAQSDNRCLHPYGEIRAYAFWITGIPSNERMAQRDSSSLYFELFGLMHCLPRLKWSRAFLRHRIAGTQAVGTLLSWHRCLAIQHLNVIEHGDVTHGDDATSYHYRRETDTTD